MERHNFRRPESAFKAGLKVGLKEANLRGPRFVLLHTGGEQGFILNANLNFLLTMSLKIFY